MLGKHRPTTLVPIQSLEPESLSRWHFGLEAGEGRGSQRPFSGECFGLSSSEGPTRWPYGRTWSLFLHWAPRPGAWQRRPGGSVSGAALPSPRSGLGHRPSSHLPGPPPAYSVLLWPVVGPWHLILFSAPALMLGDFYVLKKLQNPCSTF